MSIGPAEIVVVLIIALLVFGPSRLPQMGRSLGRGVREFKKAADAAKSELGLDQVTDSINEVKSTITEPLQEVTGTFNDLKSSVDVKSAIEAPVATAAAATAAGATAGEPAQPAVGTEEGPETPNVTPATVFADVTPATAPEAPVVEMPVVETPVEAPAAETPVDVPETPVVETPAAPVEAPVVETPAAPVEAPVAAAAPVEDATPAAGS